MANPLGDFIGQDPDYDLGKINVQWQDLGTGAAGKVHIVWESRLYVWDGISSWVRMTQPGGSSSGGGIVTQGARDVTAAPWYVTFNGVTQPVSIAAAVDISDRVGRLLGHVTVDNASIPVTGTFWQATQPVSGAFWQATQPVSIASMPSTPVTGTFWQATQPVSLAAAVDISDRAARLLGVIYGSQGQQVKQTATNFNLQIENFVGATAIDPRDISDRVARLLGHVTVDNASIAVTGAFFQATQPVSGTFWQATQPVSAASLPLPTGASTEATLATRLADATFTGRINTLGQKAMAASTPVVIASDQSAIPVSMGAASVLFRGRAATFRTLGRAGTAGQKILSIHNATGSTVKVYVTKVVVDLMMTVVKAITVAPPIIRLYKVTVLPTNGTALAKTKTGGTTTSDAAVTVKGDASADGTGSATTLTATLPAGVILTEEFAPRFITAAGYEPADRVSFDLEGEIELNALEGIVLSLDYTLATQNPITDMWIASMEWYEK